MDDKDFSYRSLIVWQKAMQFAKIVYAVVDTFPPVEKYALSDQIRRAVVSIPSNIAEGCGRTTNRDYAHFLSIARGSLYETIDEIESVATEISRMLTTLIKKYYPISNSNS